MVFDDAFFRSELWISSLTRAYPNIHYLGNGLFEIQSALSGKRITNAPFHWPLLSEKPEKFSVSPDTRLELLVPAKQGSIAASQIFQILPLDRDYAVLEQSFRPQFRKNLRAAIRIFSAARYSFGPLDWDTHGEEFYSLLMRQFKNQHRNIPPAKYFLDNLFAHSKSKSRMVLFGLCRDRRLVSGSIFGFCQNSVVQLWAASRPYARAQGASHALMSFTLQSIAEQKSGATLNLGPCPVGDSGLLFSKSRWGGESVAFGTWPQKEVKLNSSLRMVVEAGLPFLPGFVFRKVADHLAGHTA